MAQLGVMTPHPCHPRALEGYCATASRNSGPDEHRQVEGMDDRSHFNRSDVTGRPKRSGDTPLIDGGGATAARPRVLGRAAAQQRAGTGEFCRQSSSGKAERAQWGVRIGQVAVGGACAAAGARPQAKELNLGGFIQQALIIIRSGADILSKQCVHHRKMGRGSGIVQDAPAGAQRLVAGNGCIDHRLRS